MMRLLLTILGISLLCMGCKPNRDEPCRKVFVDTIAADAPLLALTPYANGDSVLFRYNQTDSVYLRVKLLDAGGKSVQTAVNPECPPDELFYKAKLVLIGDTIFNRNFHAQLFLDGFSRSLTLSINGITGSFTESTINNGTPFADSLLVEKITYKRVFQLVSQTDTILFNKSAGIIKVALKNKIWQRIK
jgi:hypothetical protein